MKMGTINRFRRDIDQAQIVVFVGFNAGDFHLNQAINDLTGLREKVFFINRPTARADPDVTAAQKRLGTRFFAGRAGLADTIKRLLAKDAPKAPRLASFAKYTPPDPAATVPTQAQMPLFWPQWHMAKCAAEELLDAEKFLEEGYSEADEYECRTGKTFDRRQLDDRRAKFLMLRAKKNSRAGAELFRDFKEAIELTDKILRQDDPQHDPFEALAEIVQTNGVVGHRIDDGLKALIDNRLDQLVIYSRKRISVLASGHQRDKAQSALCISLRVAVRFMAAT